MELNKFVEELRKIPMSKKEYELIGLEKDDILSILNEYKLIKLDDLNHEIKLFEFIANYNPIKLEIGMIRFYSFNDLLENDNYYFFGYFEVDAMAICKTTSEIVLISSEYEEDKVVLRCADDEDKFMKSIITAGRFLEESGFEENGDDQDEILKVANKCAIESGGLNYLDFYMQLLGYE